MYVPKYFQPPPPTNLSNYLQKVQLGDVVTAAAGKLESTTIPFLYRPPTGGSPQGSLEGHFARANPHWRFINNEPCLVILHGPDAYISPSWYPSKEEHGKVVPTWNYTVIHIQGHITIFHELALLRRVVEELTVAQEQVFERPWSVEDAPKEFIDAQLQAIVGVSVTITTYEIKLKLSQNRQRSDNLGAQDGLRSRNEIEIADLMEQYRPRQQGLSPLPQEG
jgi:transcriptional regulator